MTSATIQLAADIGWTLIDFIWQGTVIGCATAIALLLLRNARPQARYLVACTGLALCLAWPACGLLARSLAAHDGPAGTFSAVVGDAVAAAGAASGLQAWLQANLVTVVVCWAACTLALAMRMALGLLWIGRAARCQRTDPAWQATLARMASQFGIDRAVRLRIVEGLASPLTAGWWRPVVLLPAALVSGMPPHLLEALLAHELAHVKRYDYLVNLGQNVVETLLFYHPAVWWISHRIRAERELIADDFAASQLGEPRRLALALSELEKLQFSTHHLAQAANGGDLMVRIKRLIRPEAQAMNWKAAIPVLGLLAACGSPAPGTDAVASAMPDTPARAKFDSCAKPQYPLADVQANHTGTVSMSFLVSTSGQVRDSRIDKSSGFTTLDEAARTAIAQCAFIPASANGSPVEGWATVQYVWTLN